MYKLIALGAWDFGVEPISLVKYSSRGLIGEDLSVLIKRASSEFADKASSISFRDGEVPIHLIAMGSTEGYGPNRNGDGFTKDALRKYADTFRTSARWYRNHKNKDPDKSYGVVKLAFYNEPMQRVELLVALNSNQKAARANGGLVADDEMKLLSGGNDIPVSMACKVAYDVCSGCGSDPSFLVTRYQPGDLAQQAIDRAVLRWRGPRPLAEADSHARHMARWIGEFRARGVETGGGLDPAVYFDETRDRAMGCGNSPFIAAESMSRLLVRISLIVNACFAPS